MIIKSAEYLTSVVNFCKKHDILLISDAAYSELYFNEVTELDAVDRGGFGSTGKS